MSLEDDLRDIARRQRVYAPLREGGTKGQKELGVLRDLLESKERGGLRIYSQPQISLADPPDCVARTLAGGLAAFEITEFVSQDAVEFNERARPARGERPSLDQMVMAQWPKEGLLEHMAEILHGKDQKIYRGGPYSEYVVVVHTDEPLLIRPEAEKWLSEAVFGPYRQLTAVYMLYSYEPPTGYPYQALRVGSA